MRETEHWKLPDMALQRLGFWTENRKLGQQLQGLKGLGEVWFWRVLFLRSVLLLDGRHERECALGLGLCVCARACVCACVCVCVCVCVCFCAQLQLSPVLWCRLPSSPWGTGLHLLFLLSPSCPA